MSKLCERPGCSEPGAVAYGMVPEDLLFWIAPLLDAPTADASVLCRRHADAMVVPLGWTLDDLRDDTPRLFKPRDARPVSPAKRRRTSGSAHHDDGGHEQLQIDGTGEIDRPLVDDSASSVDAGLVDPADDTAHVADEYEPWQPEFDSADDLDGLLEVNSPLLARAFRGTDRPKR